MPNWILRCDIASLLDGEDEPGMDAARAVADRLEEFHGSPLARTRLDNYDLSNLEDCINELRYADDLDEANSALQSIYDWADSARVWLGA